MSSPVPPRPAPASAPYAGTADYIASPELMQTVNVAMTLSRPLLIKGEPGTGKTMLAQSIARGLDMPLIAWNIKSTTRAQQGLYEYDAVSRLRDSQLGDSRVSDIRNYIKHGKLWEAFTAPVRPNTFSTLDGGRVMGCHLLAAALHPRYWASAGAVAANARPCRATTVFAVETPVTSPFKVPPLPHIVHVIVLPARESGAEKVSGFS